MLKPGLLLCLSAVCFAGSPTIDNDRVAVWDLGGEKTADHDYVAVSLDRKGTAAWGHKGDKVGKDGQHTVLIELKDKQVATLANKTGLPNAFPRPHVKKLFENERVIVWSYRWNPGEPTPMHFHDKDVVVVYEEPTALKSTTPDGKETINEYTDGQIKFNLRDRTHTETLIRGTGSAVMTELK